MNNRIRLEFPSIAENVALARLVISSLASQMDFTLSDIEELKVAVSEAVSNSIIHGYSNQPSGQIILEAWQEEDSLVINVIDMGRGIVDIQKAMEPAYSTEPDRMGLGFVFMKSFMDDLTVDSQPDKGTVVRLIKKTGDKTLQLNASRN